MSASEDYGPCQHCGTLTDSGVCSSDCADALDDLRSPQVPSRFAREVASCRQ